MVVNASFKNAQQIAMSGITSHVGTWRLYHLKVRGETKLNQAMACWPQQLVLQHWLQTYQHVSCAALIATKVIPGISQGHIERLELSSLMEAGCPDTHDLRAGSLLANDPGKVTILIFTGLIPSRFFTYKMGNNTYPKYLTVFVLLLFLFGKRECQLI